MAGVVLDYLVLIELKTYVTSALLILLPLIIPAFPPLSTF